MCKNITLQESLIYFFSIKFVVGIDTEHSSYVIRLWREYVPNWFNIQLIGYVAHIQEYVIWKLLYRQPILIRDWGGGLVFTVEHSMELIVSTV